jgi:hypothetical protein
MAVPMGVGLAGFVDVRHRSSVEAYAQTQGGAGLLFPGLLRVERDEFAVVDPVAADPIESDARW